MRVFKGVGQSWRRFYGSQSSGPRVLVFGSSLSRQSAITGVL